MLRSVRRNLRRGGPVLEVLPAGPSQTGPIGPVARPAQLSISRRRAASGNVSRSSRCDVPETTSFTCRAIVQPAGRRTSAGCEAATESPVGRWWNRARRGRRETFSPACVPGRKPYLIWLCGMPIFRPFRRVRSNRPKRIRFGQAETINCGNESGMDPGR